MSEQTTETIWHKATEEIFTMGEPLNDRVIAIVGHAFLDALLERLICKFLVDAKEAEELLGIESWGPLQSFSQRTKAAYCLGLISGDEYDDLKKINWIRNELAHRLDRSFGDKAIAEKCDELKLRRRAEWLLALSDDRDLPRRHFRAATLILGFLLTARIPQAEHQRRKVPDELPLQPILDDRAKRAFDHWII